MYPIPVFLVLGIFISLNKYFASLLLSLNTANSSYSPAALVYGIKHTQLFLACFSMFSIIILSPALQWHEWKFFKTCLIETVYFQIKITL